jgi:hypothetical protein
VQFARLLAVTALPYSAALLLTGKRPTAGKFLTEVNIDGCIFEVYEANDFSLFLTFVTYFLEAHIQLLGRQYGFSGRHHSVLQHPGLCMEDRSL